MAFANSGVGVGRRVEPCNQHQGIACMMVERLQRESALAASAHYDWPPSQVTLPPLVDCQHELPERLRSTKGFSAKASGVHEKMRMYSPDAMPSTGQKAAR